jgi:hypothetical protein
MTAITRNGKVIKAIFGPMPRKLSFSIKRGLIHDKLTAKIFFFGEQIYFREPLIQTRQVS